MIKKQELPYCPIATTVHIVGSKWKLLIIQQLLSDKKRFNELKKIIPGISKKVLSETLRSMERDGILSRTVHSDPHLHVEYSLNELGRSLLPVLDGMEKWGLYYREYQKNNSTEGGGTAGHNQDCDGADCD